MKFLNQPKQIGFIVAVVLGMLVTACSNNRTNVLPIEQQDRLDNYFEAGNKYISGIFEKETVCEGVQPALTRTELNILDGLAGQIDHHVCREFDHKYTAWLDSWVHLDPNLFYGNLDDALKRNSAEYRDLIDFCRQQDDDIFLLFYQLASRAICPYDQFLLYPTHDLFGNFPEFKEYWEGVNVSLRNEKPNLEDRICNESTIWCTRKILETKYGHTYASRFAILLEARKLLLMTR